MRSSEKSPYRGGIRVSVLVALVAALLLVPAAGAFAAGTMTVNIEGSGSGIVTSGFFGTSEGTPKIECSYASPGPQTGVCSNEMSEEEGTAKDLLVAKAAAGSEFTGWVIEEGDPGVSFVCSFNGGRGLEFGGGTEWGCTAGSESGGNAAVTAIFAEEESAPTFPLTVTPEGTGSGTVTSTPAGIDCGTECEAQFEEGEEVELSQGAATGSEFTGWGGACSGTGSCKVTMTEAKEVKATFELEPEPEEFELEINVDGSGEGEVECEVEGGEAEACEATYEEGTEVALVPVAETGSEFTGWSEDCTGTGACVLAMDEGHSVTATFDEEEPQPEEFKLTITKAGTGSGTVTCDGGACAAKYPEGEEVTLAATPASGSAFSGWSGGGCSGTAPCTITVEEDTAVTATFSASKEEAKKEEPKKEEPKPAPEGKAKAAATATVKSGKASLKLTCTGGPCKGTVQLKAKVKQGKKAKTLVIGKASFNLAEGASATIKVKLSGPAKQELAKGKTVKAKASGAGVTASTVKLKQAKK